MYFVAGIFLECSLSSNSFRKPILLFRFCPIQHYIIYYSQGFW